MAISIGFRNVEEIATPVCGLVRNDTEFVVGVDVGITPYINDGDGDDGGDAQGQRPCDSGRRCIPLPAAPAPG